MTSRIGIDIGSRLKGQGSRDRCYVIPLSLQPQALSRKRGFTLVEVMVAASVLAFGIVLIFEAFFSSLKVFDYCSRTLAIAPWMDQKLWEASEEVRQSGVSAMPDASGSVVEGGARFIWQLSHSILDEIAGLYKVALDVSWPHGGRVMKLSRSAYVLTQK